MLRAGLLLCLFGLSASGALAQPSPIHAGFALNAETIGAIGTVAATVITALGGIFIGYITRSNAAAEKSLQEKIDILSAKNMTLEQDVTRIRNERDAYRVDIERMSREFKDCEVSRRRIYDAANNALHKARGILFNSCIEGGVDVRKYAIPDFPDYRAFDKPLED